MYSLEFLVATVAVIALLLLVALPAYIYLSGVEARKERIQRHVGGAPQAQKKGAKTSSLRDGNALRRKHIREALVDSRAEQRSLSTLDARLKQAGLDLGRAEFSIVMLASTVLLTLFFRFFIFNSAVASLIMGIGVGVGGSNLAVYIAMKRRQSQFLEQFVSAVDIIVRGVRSGLPLNDCIALIAEELDDPIKQEFSRVAELVHIGTPLSEALKALYKRMPIQEVHFFYVVLSTQQKIGGSISEVLENLSRVLRDRKQLRLKIRSLTAEIRMSSSILCALPFAAAIGLYFMRPGYLDPLYTTEWGILLSIVTILWMSIGIFIILNMSRLKF